MRPKVTLLGQPGATFTLIVDKRGFTFKAGIETPVPAKVARAAQRRGRLFKVVIPPVVPKPIPKQAQSKPVAIDCKFEPEQNVYGPGFSQKRFDRWP